MFGFQSGTNRAQLIESVQQDMAALEQVAPPTGLLGATMQIRYAQILESGGRLTEAERRYKKAVDLVTGSRERGSSSIRLNTACFFRFKLKDNATAKPLFLQVTTEEGDHLVGLQAGQELANILIEEGNYKEALRVLGVVAIPANPASMSTGEAQTLWQRAIAKAHALKCLGRLSEADQYRRLAGAVSVYSKPPKPEPGSDQAHN